jgi:pyruvate dehydrogenase E2 component (dihydrolipoamide acetyltransferase)
MPDVIMPRLSDSMEEGTIIRWLVADGSTVSVGEELVEIETDKATMTYEADAAGTFHRAAAEGETLAIGAVIAHVLAPGEALVGAAAAPASPAPSAPAGGASSAPVSAAPSAPAGAAGGSAPPANGASTAAGSAAAGDAAAGGAATAAGGRIKASPVARRLAAALNIDLASLVGTGPDGRIVKRDVESAPAAPTADTAPEAPAPAATSGDLSATTALTSPNAPGEEATPAGVAPVETAKGVVTEHAISRVQQTIARRMAEAKATMPDFTLTTEIDMDAAVELRAQLKAAAGDGPAPSYNDFVVKAAAQALRAHPRANGAYKDGRFELFERVNVGVAVAAQDALLVPTVMDADRRSLGEIARDTRRLAAAARDGKLTAAELAGGTFSVSNLGMFGVTHFTAVLNPPQAAILAVGALEQRAVVRDGAIVPGHRMTVTLTCDHRILYGADAAAFLADIRANLEQPLRLAL